MKAAEAAGYVHLSECEDNTKYGGHGLPLRQP